MGPQCSCIVLNPRTHEVARCPPALPTTKLKRSFELQSAQGVVGVRPGRVGRVPGQVRQRGMSVDGEKGPR